jgi:hypothetical protein
MRSELTCSLVAGLIYINTIPNDFVYDDRFVIWDGAKQGVTKRCRLSLLTDSAFVYESKCGGGGGGGVAAGVSANEYSCEHHVTWNPNKLLEI